MEIPQSLPRFNFGDIVVVEKELIGVVVKSWSPSNSRGYHYDVYVRSYSFVSQLP